MASLFAYLSYRGAPAAIDRLEAIGLRHADTTGVLAPETQRRASVGRADLLTVLCARFRPAGREPGLPLPHDHPDLGMGIARA